MNKDIVIFSGLFGLLTANTLIPDYKLKMNVLSLKNLWGPIISEYLKLPQLEEHTAITAWKEEADKSGNKCLKIFIFRMY